MKKFFKIIIYFVLMTAFFGCSSGKYTVSSEGDKAEIKLKNGKEFEAEIIAISDSAVFFASKPANVNEKPVLFYSLKQDIKRIEVQGYSGSGWISPVLLFQVLPVVLLAGAAASADNTDVGPVVLIFSIPAIITAILLGSTEGETPQWNDKMPLQEIDTIKLYTRYPAALSQTEISMLLKRYNQNAVKRYF